MNEMIKAERNKICSRKQTRMLFLAGVVLIVAYFFFFQFNYQNVFYDYDLEKMALASGFTAIEQRKEVAEIFEGKLSQNTLLTMQEKIDQAKQATVGQDENSAFSAVHVYRDQAAILEYLTNSDGSFKSLETAYPNSPTVTLGYCDGWDKLLSGMGSILSIIDKQRDSENVYFLNAVTESDLMALAQKDTDSQTVTPTAPSEPEPAAPAEPEEPSEPETSEPEPEQPAPKSNNSMMFLVIVAALAAGGLGYYFKVYKPKHDLDDAEDIDDFEFEGPEEPTVNEDEEATGEDAGQEELSEEEEAEQRRLYEEDNEDIPIEGDDDLVF